MLQRSRLMQVMGTLASPSTTSSSEPAADWLVGLEAALPSSLFRCENGGSPRSA